MNQFTCCHERRRNAVRGHPTLNGIDFLEVDDDPADPPGDRQRTLRVRFLKPIAGGTLDRPNVRIEGGDRISAIRVTGVSAAGDELTVALDRAGDFSPYVFRLVDSPSSSAPPSGYDAPLSAVEFSFKVNCPTDLDCAADRACTEPPPDEPELDYLARDFHSFRGLMLDRLAVLIPRWREESPADLLQSLIDLKAYVADYQSYQQDAVATEAYLDTARTRTSARRHARLVDYPMHDGRNARAWVHVRLQDDLEADTAVPLDAGTPLLTRVDGLPPGRIARDSTDEDEALRAGPVVFETMHAATLYREQNELCFYTWGDASCCLPRGATRASLRGRLETLREGDVLVLEELRSPEPGRSVDPGGLDLRLMPTVADESDIPSAGKGLIIVAAVRGKLHFRIFEAGGRRSVDTDETRLADKAEQIAELKRALADLWQAPSRSPSDEDGIRDAIASIVDRTYADPARRHAVRLVEVAFAEDPLPDPAQPVTLIHWHPDDALPFALTVSTDARPGSDPEAECPGMISVARGNVVLADHGRTLPEEPLGAIPEARFTSAVRRAHCEQPEVRRVPPRYRPTLGDGPLTQHEPIEPLFSVELDPGLVARLDAGELPRAIDRGIRLRRIVVGDLTVRARVGGAWAVLGDAGTFVVRREGDALRVYDPPPASSALTGDPRAATPAISLTEGEGASATTWRPRRDLLNSGPDSREFVAEVEADGRARLRFGDDRSGCRPEPGIAFRAAYRVGNGVSGNVGPDTIVHVLSDRGAIAGVRNPMAAVGGVDPESIDAVRRAAPYAFRRQERAVTPEDYAEVAARYPGVQRAAATFRWTGSWFTVFLTVDRLGGLPVDEPFEAGLRDHLERFRMAGYDLEVDAPAYVPLEVELHACVARDRSRSRVRVELLGALGSGVLPDGRLGAFHPDNFTFGRPVYLSRIYAAAAAVPGVDSVRVVTFRRQGNPDSSGLEPGVLPMGRLEIARLDNDPNRAGHGVLRLVIEGGK